MLTTDSIRKAYEDMLAELQAHDEVTITKHALGAPITSEAEQREIAEALRLPLTPTLQAYLAFANGLSLEWQYEEGCNGGSIGLIDLRTAANPETWLAPMDALEFPIESYGIEAEEALGAVYPIEFFQYDEDNVELAGVITGRDTIDVFVSEDEVACLEDTALLSFGDYLDLLFRSYGAPMARAALQMGYSNTESKRARDLYPGLFEKTYSLSELIELSRSEPNNEEIAAFFR